MDATLKDIAERAGVSQVTVSRALRGVGRVNSQTAEQIRKVADELGYHRTRAVVMPNGVRRGRGDHVLKIMLASFASSKDDRGNEIHRSRMETSLEQRLVELGGVFRSQNFETLDAFEAVFARFRPHGVALKGYAPPLWVDRLSKRLPVVGSAAQQHMSGIDVVHTNEAAAANSVVEWLADWGHHRLAWCGILDFGRPSNVPPDLEKGPPPDRLFKSSHRPRFATWAGYTHCQPDYEHDLILVERHWDRQSFEATVAEMADRLLSSPLQPTVAVCGADLYAMPLIHELTRRGVRIPEDIGVVGYGGIPQHTDRGQTLSTVVLPSEQTGLIVPELVQRRVADPAAMPLKIELPAEIVPGQTVAPRPEPSQNVSIASGKNPGAASHPTIDPS